MPTRIDSFTIVDLKTLNKALEYKLMELAYSFGFDRVFFRNRSSKLNEVPAMSNGVYHTLCSFSSPNIEFEYAPDFNRLEIVTPFKIEISVPKYVEGGPTSWNNQTSNQLFQQLTQLLTPVLETARNQIDSQMNSVASLRSA